MQHVICIKWSVDNKYILSGSDEMNIRLWKANAAEKLGVVSPTSSSSCFISELQLQSITHPRQLAASWWAGSGVAAGQPTAVRPPPALHVILYLPPAYYRILSFMSWQHSSTQPGPLQSGGSGQLCQEQMSWWMLTEGRITLNKFTVPIGT